MLLLAAILAAKLAVTGLLYVGGYDLDPGRSTPSYSKYSDIFGMEMNIELTFLSRNLSGSLIQFI